MYDANKIIFLLLANYHILFAKLLYLTILIPLMLLMLDMVIVLDFTIF